MDIHDIGVAIKIHIPDLLGDCSSGKHVAGSPSQTGKKQELFGGQIETLSGTSGLLPAEIDLKVSNSNGVIETIRCTAKQSLDPGQKFREGEWFR